MAWSTREVLTTAAIALVFAIALMPFTYLVVALAAASPIVQGLLVGVWLVPSMMVLYVVRRPGSAILAQLIIALALIPFLRVMVAGAVSMTFLFALALFGLGFINLGTGTILLLAAIYALGGALVGGLLGKLLADAISRTGVLSGLAFARDTGREA
jgi:energy-coupling factor transport system substrate-specific component